METKQPWEESSTLVEVWCCLVSEFHLLNITENIKVWGAHVNIYIILDN